MKKLLCAFALIGFCAYNESAMADAKGAHVCIVPDGRYQGSMDTIIIDDDAITMKAKGGSASVFKIRHQNDTYVIATKDKHPDNMLIFFKKADAMGLYYGDPVSKQLPALRWNCQKM